MPTGYTADLPKTFPEFALRCARAFGATIEMRDLPMDAPIPDEFKPSDYHVSELKKAQAEFLKKSRWTIDVAEREANASYKKALTEWRRNKQKTTDLAEHYSLMIREVKRWTPPSNDHVGMKKFMLEQLNSSLEFDCQGYGKPKCLSGSDYKTQQLAHHSRDIKYHTEENKKECERAAERTKWVRDLRESLAKWTT
jgi:hypothetical protein